MQTKVAKREPVKINLKNVLVGFSALKKPVENQKGVKEYKLQVYLEKGTDSYKQFIEACKAVSEGITKTDFKDIMRGSNPKLANLKSGDLERNPELDETLYFKTSFKSSEDRPPSIYDWTKKKTAMESPDTIIGGTDRVTLDGVLFFGRHEKGGFYISSYVKRIALLESNYKGYDDPSDWLKANGVEETADDIDSFFEGEEKKQPEVKAKPAKKPSKKPTNKKTNDELDDFGDAVVTEVDLDF